MSDPLLPAARLSSAEIADYLMELGGTLLSYGCPTHRLEEVIRAVARAEGSRADVFAVPTGLILTLRGEGQEPLTRMNRVDEWAVDLARLTAVDAIFNDVADRRCSIQSARDRLHALESTKPPFPLSVRVLAAGGAAGAAAVFFRGGMSEVAVSAGSGLLLAGLSVMLRWSRNPGARLLGDFLGGLIVALMAWAATALLQGDLSREVMVLSAVILLVPGMALTTGLDELAHKNLVSGGARVMEAFIVFLSILFGIALVVGLERTAGLASSASAAPLAGAGLPGQAAAMVVASLSFAVIFSVPRAYLPHAALSGAIGWIATSLGTRYLPGHMSAFAAALTICLFSNALARATQRPAQLFLLPGLILLVPGSFGFLSLEAFLRGEFLGGAAKAFEMFLIAGALVTGILVASVLLPAKKIL